MNKAKSTVRRLLGVFLCVVMIMALAPVVSFADGELTGTVTANVSYVANDGKFTDVETYTFEGTEGATVTLADSWKKAYSGYELDSASSKMENTIYNHGSEEAANLMVNFTLVYNSVVPATPEYVTVHYVYETMSSAESVQVPYGSNYTPKTDYKAVDGYVFSGWKLETAGADLNNLTVDCTFKGSYSEDPNGGKYYVEHYLQNLNGTYALAAKELVTGAANGVTVAADKSMAKNYVGFKFERGEGSAHTSIYAEQSGTVKIYYTRNSYTVTYMVDGKQSGKTETYKYGETVTVRSAPDAKKGYTFVGWDADYALGAGSTMPAANVTFSGSMVAGDGVKYTVNIYRENDAGEYELYESSERTGVVGKLTTVKAPKVEGYKAQSFMNRTIAADGSTVINVYYDLIAQPYVPVRPNVDKKPAAEATVGTMDLLGGQAAVAVDDVDAADEAAEPSVSVENPEVADIGEEETPLAPDAGNSGISILLYIIIGVALVLAAGIVYIKNKKLYNT